MSKEESVPEDAKHNRRTTVLASFSPARLEAKGFPAPSEGFIVTHLLIVAGQERSRDFYSSVLGGEVIREDDPAVVRLGNTWVVINSGGAPTDDKPYVIAALDIPFATLAG